eukprot:95057-Pyramimonas_sp.AAC.1
MSGGLSSELANQTSYFERGGRKVRPHVDDRAVALARLKPRRALSAQTRFICGHPWCGPCVQADQPHMCVVVEK